MLKRFLFTVTCMFCAFSFSKSVSANEIVYYKTLNRVNFRSGPSTNDEILDVLDFGTAVSLVYYDESEDGWSIVTYNNVDGFIKSEYIGSEEDFLKIEESYYQSGNNHVEFLDWSDAKQVISVGADAEIYDVYTGLTYYIRSFSNGNHADVEPITKEDTAIMKKTFGNVWSWDVRPVWVTVNGRTIAASINGMPHGGGVNNSNGMDGQVCLHFKGSSTHNGNSSYTQLHQDYAYVAYNASK